MYIENDGDFWFMTLCAASGCKRFAEETLKKETEGLLVTMTVDEEGNSIEKTWKLEDCEERETILREHMDLFYERKWLKQIS